MLGIVALENVELKLAVSVIIKPKIKCLQEIKKWFWQ
jgi:hypothetical protein